MKSNWQAFERCPIHGELHPKEMCPAKPRLPSAVRFEPRQVTTARDIWPICIACESERTMYRHAKRICLDCGAIQENCCND